MMTAWNYLLYVIHEMQVALDRRMRAAFKLDDHDFEVPHRAYMRHEFGDLVESLAVLLALPTIIYFGYPWWCASLVGAVAGVWNARKRYRNVWKPALDQLDAPLHIHQRTFFKSLTLTVCAMSAAFTAYYLFLLMGYQSQL